MSLNADQGTQYLAEGTPVMIDSESSIKSHIPTYPQKYPQEVYTAKAGEAHEHTKQCFHQSPKEFDPNRILVVVTFEKCPQPLPDTQNLSFFRTIPSSKSIF